MKILPSSLPPLTPTPPFLVLIYWLNWCWQSMRCVKECTYVCVCIVCMLTYYWRTFNKDFCWNSKKIIHFLNLKHFFVDELLCIFFFYFVLGRVKLWHLQILIWNKQMEKVEKFLCDKSIKCCWKKLKKT
jgi:hypothetical protein